MLVAVWAFGLALGQLLDSPEVDSHAEPAPVAWPWPSGCLSHRPDGDSPRPLVADGRSFADDVPRLEVRSGPGELVLEVAEDRAVAVEAEVQDLQALARRVAAGEVIHQGRPVVGVVAESRGRWTAG